LVKGGAVAPSLNHLLGDVVDIGGNARGEAAAEGGIPALGKRVRAIAIEQLFERGQAL